MSINGLHVVDSHVHLLPGRLGEKVRAFFDASVGTRVPLAYPNDHAAVTASLHREGVDGIWTLPYSHKPGIAHGLNESTAAITRQFTTPSFSVIGGATVHPGDDDPVAVITHAVDVLGLRVLKLHCSVGDFSIDDTRLDKVMSFASERRLPIVIHLGHNVNGRTESDELPSISRVADAHPEVRLILAHCGHHAAREAIQLLDRHEYLYADLTPVVTEWPDVDASHIEPHSGKILFGSDSPNTALTVTDGIRHWSSLGLSKAALSAVLGGNAQRLIADQL